MTNHIDSIVKKSFIYVLFAHIKSCFCVKLCYIPVKWSLIYSWVSNQAERKIALFFTQLFMTKHIDAKVTLLYRFHVTVIIISMIAIGIDLYFERFNNASIEGCMMVLLIANLWWLHRRGNLAVGVYIFLAVLTTGLFSLIYINHFATMSVVFVLLLPLLTMLFIRLRDSLLIAFILFAILALLLYLEYLVNPSNPLAQNPHALFNLGYTAAIIFLFGLLYHFSIVKTFDELDNANRQKEMLLKEVHHRVKNNLNVIASIVGLQANGLPESQREHLLGSKMRIETIAIVHEMLYRADDLEHIDFNAYMHRLTRLLLGMYGRSEITVDIRGETLLPLDSMVQLGIIANELVTNSIKYAFDGEGGTIVMSLETGSEHLFIYSDDGCGSEDPEALLQKQTLGLKLIRLAVKQLRGDMKIDGSRGLRFEIAFEKEER